MRNCGEVRLPAAACGEGSCHNTRTNQFAFCGLSIFIFSCTFLSILVSRCSLCTERQTETKGKEQQRHMHNNNNNNSSTRHIETTTTTKTSHGSRENDIKIVKRIMWHSNAGKTKPKPTPKPKQAKRWQSKLITTTKERPGRRRRRRLVTSNKKKLNLCVWGQLNDN